MYYFCRMSRVVFIQLLILLFCSAFTFSQKREREERISEDHVPAGAIEWSRQIQLKTKRQRWYHQRDGDEESYEYKFIHQRRRYSIEFELNGKVMDIEIFQKKNDLHQDRLKKIKSTLYEQFDKIKIIKVQRQYTADDEEELLKLLNDKRLIEVREIPSSVAMKFEIEFEGKNADGWKMYEGLLTNEAVLQSLRPIELRSAENLNY